MENKNIKKEENLKESESRISVFLLRKELVKRDKKSQYFFGLFFPIIKKIKNILRKLIEKYKIFCQKITPSFLKGFWRKNFPLLFAIVLLTPAFILFFVFIDSQLGKKATFASNFTGEIKVSKQTTTLSTNGNWYTAMANSGDGINGDAETGTFNPIHPGQGAGTEPTAGGIAMGHVAMGATTTYAAAQFIGFKPDQSGNLAGVQLVFENLTSTALSNSDLVVEFLRFPSASYSGGWSNYLTGTQGTYVYPADTEVLRRTVWQFNKGLSGENMAPGNFGRATFDFRFDPPVAVNSGGGTGDHYGIRILNMGATAATGNAFGVWGQSPQLNGFPSVNGTVRTIGVDDIDNSDAPTMNMPLALTGNSILGGSASLLGGMVIGNSVAGVGMSTIRRTENEHYTATYSSSNSNWTIIGTASGTQSRKLITATDGGTGDSWVNDGVAMSELSANSTATTVICVNSTSGFAQNQYIDIWDSDTAPIQRTISAVSPSHASCSDGPAITVTSAMVTGYTISKNATVTQATWKQRIIQGAVQSLQSNTDASAVVCVPDNAKFEVGGTLAIYDNNSPIITRTISSFAGTCGVGQPITLNSSPGNGTYTTAQNSVIAEVSATLSNSGIPDNGAVMRWTSFNHPQNPADSTLLARTTSVSLAYAKSQAPATSATNYPYLSNRHIFFVAYGDANTDAPADGDIIIVGNGKSDPDINDSSDLTADKNWSSKESHIVTIDRSWDAPMAYSGTYGAAVGDGAGTRGDFAAWSPNGGWISALVLPGSQMGIDNSSKKHYRIVIPGKIVVNSDASVALGKPGEAIPASSGHDIFFDTVSPSVSTTLTDATVNGNATTLNVSNTTGLAVGDWIVLDDNNSVPTARLIAAIQSATQVTLVAGGAATPVYTSSQGAFIAKGLTTELPTGTDRRAGIYTMTGLNAATTPAQSNTRAGRVALYADGSDDFRTEKSDLAVDIDGNIDTGYLGNNLTDSGNTWVDVKDDVVGDWQPLDQIAVAGGTNQLADNNYSSPGLGRTDDLNQMPVWTGASIKTDTGSGGRNALPTPNMEIAEIGTIPLTNIYNADYNAGTPVYSANYNNSANWTVFSDNANTEVNDAVYFGDQGSNMPYALEFNLGQVMDASANYVWEYYKSGVGWTNFIPRDSYQYSQRTGVSLPLSADTVNNSLTASLAEGGTVFGLDQIVMIDDNDSDPIYRRLGTTAPTATLVTFSEPIPSGYTVAQGATITRLNGGQWQSTDPANIFTVGTGRKIIAWTPDDLNGVPAKSMVNGISAYWVRARIASFISWTTSPTNQTTPVGMSGVEKIDSGFFNVSSGVQEAKVSEITPGTSFNPNENYILEYGNSPGWTQIMPIAPSAPYTWHINNGNLSQNTATADFHTANGNFAWGDYTVMAKVRMRTTPDATSRKIGIVLRDSLDGNGYGVLIEKTSTVQRIGLYPMALGLDGTVFANTTKTFADNSWYWIKANVTGIGASTVLSAKFWADGSAEPGSWDVAFTTNAAQGLWNTGRIGLFADAMIADFDEISVDNGGIVLADNFDSTGTWKLRGSINGDLGTVTPGTPFSSNYINLTLKQKGGWNGTNNPEIGDKIYISSASTRSYKGISGTGTSAITTDDTNTVYENIDFEWDPESDKYNVEGSATGAMGTATPGSSYTATGGKIGLTIPSGEPTATKFGDGMLLLQSNYLVNNGSWVGNNGQGSAVLVWPSYTLTSSAITPRYNIEGISGTATARQNGTLDFWFKTNYDGVPSYLDHPKGMYLFDQANQGNTDRLFIRHNPEGYLEAGVFAGTSQGILLRQSFSATAGEWHHFRLVWDETRNTKRAWLDGVAFSSGQASAVGTRGVNGGIIRIGNTWTYDAPFDGSIDELAIFDDAIDTSSSCDWGDFDVPTSSWTNAQTAGCADAESSIGTNIFRASFDQEMNPQEGSIMTDYAFGNPAMIFTNGADTGNERIRIITYPARTRIWVDNTGEKYTPSARIKAGSGYQENAALATLTGWSNNFTYHHKAARQSEDRPTYSPVLNLKRSTHIWSVEPITQNGATMVAPINAGMGFGMGTLGLSGLGTIDFSDVSMENQYTNFAILTNPFTSLAVKPSQNISNSVFYNYYDRAYTVSGKTQGTNNVGAYFVTTHFAAANIGNGYNAGASQNVGIDGSIFMGCRNAYVTVPPVAANGAASFYSGRLYSIKNSEFHNNGITGLGTSGALNFGTGVAKVEINNNIFSVNNQGIRLYGNAFINMENNIFDGHVSDSITTVSNEYGAGIRSAQSYSSVAVTDKNSIFGRGLWNEADLSLPPNTGTFEAESLLQFTGEGTQFNSPLLFGTADYGNMNRVGDEYLPKTIPGVDIRATYSDNKKDIVNLTTLGLMRTSGSALNDETVRTPGGYAWRMEPTDPEVPLDYTVKLVGVAGKPLAATGYIRLNSNYGSNNLPTVTLSGLGMSSANLTWTAQPIADEWQQFIVSGTPNESALAELKISAKLDYIQADSGTSELISNATGNYLPALLEDNDKAWTPDQWVGYKLRDSNGKIFEIVKNTDRILYLKGMVVPHLLSTTFAALTTGDYIIYNEPYFYLDDVSVLSGSVDTGTLDFHAAGQPVSPWLSTGLTAEGVWSAQWSNFMNNEGSFGQLLGDSLVAQYADIFGGSPTTTVFNTNLTSTTDDFYLNGAIIFTEGQNKGAVRRISDYGGASKTVTVDPALPFAPSEGDRFAILAATASSGGTSGTGGASAEEIWNYAVRTLTDAALNSGSLATSAEVANIRADIADVITELGTGNISAIKTKTDSIDWDDITGLMTTTGDIKIKTDTINWSDISAIKTSTDTINWSDVTGIKLNTDTISWGDITDIKSNVATLISEIGVGNISAIKTSTDTIDWDDITGIITSAGEIKAKTDTIDWANITGIKTATDTINWSDVTGIKTKTDTIAWGDIAILQSSVNALNNISASDIWGYANRTITGEVSLSSSSAQAIWDTACTLLSTTGSVGKVVCDNLDAKVSELGSSNLTAEDVWNYTTKTITGFSDPALAAIANSVWSNATRGLTSYGNDITAQEVWDVLTSSLTTIDSIGKLLVVNVDETISSRASQESVDAMASNLATVLSEIGVGNISAIKTKTDDIKWSDITGLITTTGEIKNKTDTINWSDIGSIKTKTDIIDWDDITAIELKTRTIEWGDINEIKSNVATLISEIGVGNISAIKTKNDSIDWDDITAIITSTGEIKNKTDTIDWNKVDEIKTKTDAIDWVDVTGIKLKTDTINWNDVSTIASRVDTTISSRASQSSLDSHEASQSSFREDTSSALTNISSDLSDLSINVADIQNNLSSIDTKIDTIATNLGGIDTKIDSLDTSLESVRTVLEDTNIKVSAIQTVVGNILNKWGSYSASDIVGYVDTLKTYIGLPEDEVGAQTLFGKIKDIQGSAGAGESIDLIYAQVQSTYNKLLDVQLELGYNEGKSTTAYDDIAAIKNYMDTAENSLVSLDSRTSDIASSVKDVSSDLSGVTEKIGKVSLDSFAQHFEVNKTDVAYLKNKIIELKAISEINRQLIERNNNEPIVKVLMEWGSVVIKFIIVNPSDSTDQKVPFKAYLPKEVLQEYIMDLGGLSLSYDATTEQYYVTSDLFLKAGESVTRSVEIKDIWLISEEEVNSLRKQSEEMAAGLAETSYNAQALTLKTDINTRLDKILRKQKDSNATPQDHILAYRENKEELVAVNENIKGMKDLVLNSGTGKNFLASIGGIQTFATWGIVLVLIFGMGALGFFYYALWRKKIVYLNKDKDEIIDRGDGEKNVLNKTLSNPTKLIQKVELPTPSPFKIAKIHFCWFKKIVEFILILLKNIFKFISIFFRKNFKILVFLIILIFLGVSIIKYIDYRKEKKALEESKVETLPNEIIEEKEENNFFDEKRERVLNTVEEIEKKAKEITEENKEIDFLIQEKEVLAENFSSENKERDGNLESAKNELIVKETPTGWLNVREDALIESALITKIYPEEKYFYSEIRNGWYKIEIKDGKEGWVIGDYVKILNESAQEKNKEEVLGASISIDSKITIKQTVLEFVKIYDQPTYTGEIIGKAYPGDIYSSSETYGPWRKIIIANEKEGWILDEYISLIEDDNNLEIITVVSEDNSYVNIRESASQESAIIKKIYFKNKFKKLEEKDDWIKIELLEGNNGWVSKKFIK